MATNMTSALFDLFTAASRSRSARESWTRRSENASVYCTSDGASWRERFGKCAKTVGSSDDRDKKNRKKCMFLISLHCSLRGFALNYKVRHLLAQPNANMWPQNAPEVLNGWRVRQRQQCLYVTVIQHSAVHSARASRPFS